MPFYRSNYPSDEFEIAPLIIDRYPCTELSNLFRSRETKVIRIVEEAPIRHRPQVYTAEDRLRNDSPSPRPSRRRGQEHTRVVHFEDNSPSPPPVRRKTERRAMTAEKRQDGFTPLPPVIRKSSSFESDSDRGFDIEDRIPARRASKSSKKYPSHRRKDSKLEREPEFIQVASSPRQPHESAAERDRRKQAEMDAAYERALRNEAVHVATKHADVANQERVRREEVEELGRRFESAYMDERRETEAAKARADELAKQLDREKRDKKYLERKAAILEREQRVTQEAERIARDRAVLRPVHVHQDLRPIIDADPGTDAIRRAQEDSRRRQQDDSLFGQQRRGRSKIIYDDDFGRRGPRRE